MSRASQQQGRLGDQRFLLPGREALAGLTRPARPAYQAMSDPDRNPQFHRIWTEPLRLSRQRRSDDPRDRAASDASSVRGDAVRRQSATSLTASGQSAVTDRSNLSRYRSARSPPLRKRPAPGATRGQPIIENHSNADHTPAPAVTPCRPSRASLPTAQPSRAVRQHLARRRS